MEDTLGDVDPNEVYLTIDRLNPCSNGRYSQSGAADYLSFTEELVLILVLMEDTLREVIFLYIKCK